MAAWHGVSLLDNKGASWRPKRVARAVCEEDCPETLGNVPLYEKTEPLVVARKIAFVGSYMPRQCGIATFTADLRRAVAERFPESTPWVVALTDIEAGYPYPDVVTREIQQASPVDYAEAADFVNAEHPDLVCLQHEYGIFGGDAGAHILLFLERLKVPVVTTLHTVLEHPDAEQERVLNEVIRLSSRLVVMTAHTRELLLGRYEIQADKVDQIAHGIPDTQWREPELGKAHFGVEGRPVLLTFGLLSPGKGIELALRALPSVVERFPNAIYFILGATHPHLVRDQGEEYRESLETLARELNVEKNVRFFDRFVELDELTQFIGAADLYLTPYLNEAQAVSGTLAYAFGCGKPVISTPYWHAKELLDDGNGVLVPFNDSDAIATAVVDLLADRTALKAMEAKAYKLGRSMVWSRTAEKYAESFDRA